MKIEMTGREDREGPWKVAIGGFPGAGKTMFASTAENPLFVFFQENPRLKSIASRHIPHVKVTNEERQSGVVTVQDRLNSLMISLQMNDHDYKTLVIDTGDELFQAMKQGRRMKTGGEFGPGDWGWLADAYRDVVTGLIDLDMDVIFLYHLKTDSDGEDGQLVRNLSLQGSSTDEAPGWFDVVAALDTFETTNEEGDTVVKRVLLTHSSRMYPWAKDHSGEMPVRFEISNNFVGDFPRMLGILHSSDDLAEKEVLDEIDTTTPPVTDSGLAPPTPDELQAKKAEQGDKDVEPEPEKPEEEQEEQEEQEEPEREEEVSEEEPIPTESEDETAEQAEVTESVSDDQDEESPALEKAEELVKEELGGEEVIVCSVCKNPVEDENLLELSQIRFRTNLCREHFKEKIAEARAS